jgi:hypothetical protein
LMPSLADERQTYQRWGWVWTASDEPQASPDDSGYTVGSVDLHNDTEGDDLWSYLNMHNRLAASGHPAATRYLNRATAWAKYFKDQYLADYAKDPYKQHAYGQGLAQWARQFNDSAALTRVVDIAKTYRNEWLPWPGPKAMSYYGPRGYARQLLFAVVAGDAITDANVVDLRDRLLDLWINSTDWDNTRGMYWVSEEQAGYDGLGTQYSQGLRYTMAFQINILAEAFWRAYASPNVSDARKSAVRSKLIAMATFVRDNGVHPTRQYSGSRFGWWPSQGGTWHNIGATGFADPVYTTAHVGLMAMGYKLTGDQSFLDRGRHYLNRGTKGEYGTGNRLAPDNEVHHFIDSLFGSEGIWLAANGGELQYTYLIFENGGVPTVVGSSSSGTTTSGGTTSGDTSSGATTSGGTTSGDTSSGGTTSGDTSSGGTTSGGTSSDGSTTTGTSLSALAASMQPGTWARLQTNGLTNELMVIQPNHILGYADSAVWDPRSKQFMIVGGSHAPDANPNQRHIVYSETTNSWRQEANQSWFCGNGCVSHAYDNHALDPTTGAMFYKKFYGTTVYKYDIASKTWSTIAPLPGSPDSLGLGGFAYFPELGGLVYAAYGTVYLWKPAENRWTILASNLPMSSYHSFAEYNPVHKVVLFGGGEDSSDLYKLDRNGTVTRLKNAPLSRWIPETTVTVDPVSGDFLVLRRQASPLFYRYDVLADSWQALPVYPFASANNPDLSAVAAPIAEYGVVMFLKYGWDPGEVYLYKHSAR